MASARRDLPAQSTGWYRQAWSAMELGDAAATWRRAVDENRHIAVQLGHPINLRCHGTIDPDGPSLGKPHRCDAWPLEVCSRHQPRVELGVRVVRIAPVGAWLGPIDHHIGTLSRILGDGQGRSRRARAGRPRLLPRSDDTERVPSAPRTRPDRPMTAALLASSQRVGRPPGCRRKGSDGWN